MAYNNAVRFSWDIFVPSASHPTHSIPYDFWIAANLTELKRLGRTSSVNGNIQASLT